MHPNIPDSCTRETTLTGTKPRRVTCLAVNTENARSAREPILLRRTERPVGKYCDTVGEVDADGHGALYSRALYQNTNSNYVHSSKTNIFSGNIHPDTDPWTHLASRHDCQGHGW